MIQANELRIGNWVQRPESVRIDILDGGKIYWLVDSLMIRDCEYYKDNWAFEPIPITPEILEKCGFERQNYGWTINKLNESDDSCFCLFDMNYNSGALSLKLNAAYCPCPEINYLHQLQNLYFALTGEELTYNP